LLEAHYSELRALLAQPQPGGPALLAGMVALDLRTTQMAQDYPEDPAESEKLSLKLVEGEELMGDLARAAYLQYRTQIEGDPAEAMLAFSTFLRDAPLAAKRGRRQAGLLFSAARSVWHKEHLARDLFKVDGEQRCAALAAVGARWREAIGDEEGHPLQEDLDRLQRRLATVERGLR
ncbi:MAG: hypothetical protein KDD82_11695, partial [Planctomycetes bacterium]|nr:hypothetical protein [Planctomycetota bacterium]